MSTLLCYATKEKWPLSGYRIMGWKMLHTDYGHPSKMILRVGVELSGQPRQRVKEIKASPTKSMDASIHFMFYVGLEHIIITVATTVTIIATIVIICDTLI